MGGVFTTKGAKDREAGEFGGDWWEVAGTDSENVIR